MRLSRPGYGEQALAEPPTVERPPGQSLIAWPRRHRDTHLESLPRHARPDTAAVLRQILNWPSYTATASGLRTARPDHVHAARTRTRLPAAGVVGMNTLLWIAVLLAAVLTTAILTRRRSAPGHAVDTAIRAAAALTTVGLAGIAAAISYQHLLTLAQEHGQTGWRASAFPLSVDGLELVSSLVLLADRRADRRSGWLPWAALGAGAVASLFANIAVAEHNWIARTIAGWPALALIIAIKLLSGLLEHAATPPPTVDASSAAQATPTDDNPVPDVPDGATSRGGELPRLPVDLLKRIPVNPTPYQGWRTAWAALRDGTDTKKSIAATLGVSVRHLQFVEAAGRAGLLDDPTPPAHRIAALATTAAPSPAPINGVPVLDPQ